MNSQKRPFDVDLVFERLRIAVAPYPPAAMFQLADEGYSSLFEQLIACILSIRTYDEVALPAAKRLFALARTPAAIAALTPAQIDAAIGDVTFHEAKAPQIHTIARAVVEEFGGELPPDAQLLQSFRGVGPKCTNLALGIAAGVPAISVDTHVHRVTNRWGYVETRTPEQTMKALAERLPQQYWIEINRLLVPFGKHICTGTRPHCSTCLLLNMCRQVDVTTHR
ncbi:MAG: DNA lyase [Chloroflexi bacterium]|nr:MAG: DNA lyase [Chloroflexota bacterium]